MKFDFIIGNPPYQEETAGTSDLPVYNYYMDEAYKAARAVLLISPARFLFNAGKTPKRWNRKMLEDPHFKVIKYEPDSEKFFRGVDIKGGLAITYRDSSKYFGPITRFTPYRELNNILKKVLARGDFKSMAGLVYQQTKWDLDALYADYPESRALIGSGGRERRLTTPIFSTLAVFSDSPAPDKIRILGLLKNKRVYRYIDKRYIDLNSVNLFKHKVVLAASSGSGAFGETFPAPSIEGPGTGYTQSFIGFGALGAREEAEALGKYLKSKFARALLSILKATQHNHKDAWSLVPAQDFSSASDIDWSSTTAKIGASLYDKYGLNFEEIVFIENNVKPME
ncbi:MAG: Eco57I restriction-modification methylase domain-containing protein [Desulfovibrio sp.]|nr:Eco57I restriction-modification methylase domain-containing protein [Desulfovibrio sp.]